MAVIDFPPPKQPVDPARLSIVTLDPDTVLVRVYDPKSKYNPGPRTFRYYGPLKRFDHQRGLVRGSITTPGEDDDRGVHYAGRSLKGSIVEVFGDDRVIDRGTFRAVYSRLRVPLQLLDIRGDAAIRAGVLHAIGQIEDMAKTQAWARHFYETPATYGMVDGLLYANAHNGEDAVLLYERGANAIASARQRIRRLAAPEMELELLRIADVTGFALI